MHPLLQAAVELAQATQVDPTVTTPFNDEQVLGHAAAIFGEQATQTLF